MKKLVLSFIALILVTIAFSQISKPDSQIKTKDNTITRCGTMLKVEQYFARDIKARAKASEQSRIGPTASAVSNYRTSSIVTIPVVIHVVLPNPDQVTDANVQFQIDKLNLDFSGLNPDSSNIPPEFQAVRGHSQIRFVLARQTPSGALTNGINRVRSNTTSNVTLNTDPIKRSSQGGADVWDPSTYINIWVGLDGSGLGLLGYAQFPEFGAPADDGIFINATTFGNNPCYITPGYNLGRTTVHEMGHYFGLLHIWGDDQGSCTGDDFRSLTTVGSACNLPPGLFNPAGQGNTPSDVGDTPNQSSETTNCSSGIVTNTCSPDAPGKMYQNFMDYTLDACYSMFTRKQAERMEWIIDNCRSGLKTSQGGTIPAGAVTIDASPFQPVNPGGSEVTGCNTISYPSTIACASTLVPKVSIRNNGLNTLNTVTVGMIINGGPPVIQNLSPNLPFGYTTIVTFGAIAVSAGTYTIKFYTTNANGVNPDQVPSNDTLTTTLTVATPVSLPLTEGFEGTTFPPMGWTIRNPNGDFTWQRVSPGHNSNFSAAIDNYNNDGNGRTDELRTPRINFTAADSVVLISFDVAHKYYPDPVNYDTLTVLVSNDCGNSFTTVYKKWGSELATADTSETAYITPADSDWRRDKITLRGSILSTGNIIVAFRNSNRFGNNIFLDNINIARPDPGDLQLVSIDQPATILCSPSTVPAVTVKNTGSEPVTSFTLTYSIDNGPAVVSAVSGLNLLPNQEFNVTLNPAFTVTPGTHSIMVFISNVLTTAGSSDQTRSNDTVRKAFTLVGKLPVPFAEGFESGAFPPENWAVENPDGDITWERTTAAAKSGIGSMVIRNFDNPKANSIDKFISPVITGTSSLDSLFITFDLSYTLGTAGTVGDIDTLELQISRDCGRTHTTVWKKWGAELQTSSKNGRFTPAANDWKNIKVFLSPFVNTPGFQVKFTAKGNRQNNLYIDNINLYGITLPQNLKDKGYLVYPNPFAGSFAIQHYLAPINLQKATLYNSVGQAVWQQSVDGATGSYITVNVPHLSPGVYLLNLTYKDKVIVERLVKN